MPTNTPTLLDRLYQKKLARMDARAVAKPANAAKIAARKTALTTRYTKFKNSGKVPGPLGGVVGPRTPGANRPPPIPQVPGTRPVRRGPLPPNGNTGIVPPSMRTPAVNRANTLASGAGAVGPAVSLGGIGSKLNNKRKV